MHGFDNEFIAAYVKEQERAVQRGMEYQPVPADQPAIVEFYIDINGKAKEVTIVESSGNPKFDSIFQSVIQQTRFRHLRSTGLSEMSFRAEAAKQLNGRTLVTFLDRK